MDFTIKQYIQLLTSLQDAGFFFRTFSEYLSQSRNHAITQSSQSSQILILRHDVDLLPQNSLRFAKIQAKMGTKGSYYFRAVPESWDDDIIKEIADLGHEVGYHYETMDTAFGKLKFESSKFKSSTNNEHYDRLIDLAYEQFVENLEKLRRLVPVTTICMHGSPRSKFDNKDIWKKYDYKSLGLIGEPYYDMDFDKFFYLTDTGRRWDGWKTSVRDKVAQQEEWVKQGLVYHSTQDIIRAVQNLDSKSQLNAETIDINTSSTLPSTQHPAPSFPNQIMFTFHPQRWTEGGLPWLKELVLQNAKNFVKSFLVK